MWITYRHHPEDHSWRTEIMLEVDDRPAVKVKFPERYARHSHEDARLFMFRGKPHISAVISRSSLAGQKFSPCITGYGELTEDGQVLNWVEPKIGKNDWTGQEKNWVFFGYKDILHVIYEVYPVHTVYELRHIGIATAKYSSDCPPCSFGEPRGGTSSLPFENGQRIRFFHANQTNKKSDMWWTYHVGALVMEDRPPFRIIQLSKHPILSGDERYIPGHRFWKGRVCIPYGAVEIEGGWSVALGVNDSQCAIAHIDRSMLNL